MKPDIPIFKDKNGISIKENDMINHNGNIYFVKWSVNLEMWILRANNDMGMNWRDMQWFERCGKYCEVVGSIDPN